MSHAEEYARHMQSEERKKARRVERAKSSASVRDRTSGYARQNRYRAKMGPEAWAQVVRVSRYKTHYGITLEQYDAMFAAQGGLCAICKLAHARRLAVDHCHVTKKVRGLLCVICNHGLGQFRDSVDRLRAAADYLEQYAITSTVESKETA